MTIEIEAGKYYRNRKGDVVGPVNVSSGGCYISGHYYWTDGRKFLNKNNPNDLIEEVPNPNDLPIPSDYHLQRAIDVMNSPDDVECVKKYPEIFAYTINVARYIAQHEPEPVDLVLNEARRRVEKYYGDPVGSLNSGACDDHAIMKLALDALRFDASTLK